MDWKDRLIIKYVILSKQLDDTLVSTYNKLLSGEALNKEDILLIVQAVKSRIIKYYIFGVFVAVIPTALSLYFLSRQNNILERQTKFFENQYEDESYQELTSIITNESEAAITREYAARNLISRIESSRQANPLRTVTFVKANLEDVDLTGTNLSNINFDQANLRGCKMVNAQVDNCTFAKTSLVDADVINATFRDCDFTETSFGTYLNPSIRTNSLRLRYPNYSYNTTNNLASLNGVTFEGCDFNGAIVNFCDFQGATFENCVWDPDAILPEQVYGSILLGSTGLNQRLLDTLKKFHAIVDRQDIDFHITEAMRLKAEAATIPEMASTEQDLALAISFYQRLKDKYK